MKRRAVIDALRIIVEEDGLSELPDQETLSLAEMQLLNLIGDTMLKNVGVIAER